MLFLLVVGAVVVLTSFGWAVLTLVPDELRRQVLPAAPVVGIAFLVCGLHATGILLPVSVGVWVLGVVAVALIARFVVRHGVRRWADRTTLAWCAVAVAVGIPLAAVSMAPSIELGSPTVVSATPSNDAVYYVSVTGWLEEHSILDAPAVAPVPAGQEPSGAVPGDGPAQTALDLPLRVGQELVQAALNVLTSTNPTTTFVAWLGTWVLLIPGACVGAARVLGASRTAGLVAGTVVASSTVLVQQAYNQNAASVLGVALVPLAMGLFVASLRPGTDRRTHVVAALVLGAVVGTYSEFAPFLAPALIAAAVVRRTHVRAAVLGALQVILLAVVLAPLAWYRAVVSLLVVGSGGDNPSVSPYLDPDVLVVADRLVGFPTATSSTGVAVAGGLALVVLGGWVAAVLVGPARGLATGFAVSSTAVVGLLTAEGLDYAQRRAVEITFSVGLFLAVLGWASVASAVTGLVRRFADRRRPAVARLVAAGIASVVLVSLAAWVSLNARSSLDSLDPVALPGRHVDGSFTEAAAWVRELGGDEGEDLSVLVPQFFDQQWMTLVLADEDDVEYPALRPDYLRVSSYWSGGTDRYWLVGDGVQVAADPGVVIRQNDRFRLLDLDRGEAVVVAPYDLLNWNLFVRPGGGFATVGDASALVVRTPGVSQQIQLTVRGESTAPLDVVVSTGRGISTSVDGLTADPEQVVVDLPSGSAPVVVSMQVDSPSDPAAARWVVLSGVTRQN
ncbi:hypothetical protein SAMN03159343_2622 [Klenkia marina]|uniref:Uncharacterized protein n=1 Tax=Klenkia marina TaxID=1960309 RepID=A0A1G4YEA2_9ACTN|nr:hypothetical protein [Klenkia marina]SCX51743.1 hypothetical protein SAMN03159343_2622 [Klenkia marina]